MAVEQRSKFALPWEDQTEAVTPGLCWPARNPVLLLLPGCQAVKIKTRDLDSRPCCDCPSFLF